MENILSKFLLLGLLNSKGQVIIIFFFFLLSLTFMNILISSFRYQLGFHLELLTSQESGVGLG